MGSAAKPAAKKKPNGAAATAAEVPPSGDALAQAPASAAEAASTPQEISPEMRAKLAELRERVQLSVGQAVLAMMNLPRYKTQSLGDLGHLVIEPLLRDRLAIAAARKKDGPTGDTKNHVPADETATAGIAIWASVSDEVDRAIREQITSGVFPTRLAPDDWASGDKIWLLDLIAPNRQLATAVLANFRQIAGEKPVSIHPIVARSVDPEVLEKMRVKAKGEAE
ncbi:MAG: toxin-activating lysine-acyltransferase [Sphingomonadaceae bacterium]